MKHTPGPWKITRCEDGLFMCHTDGDTICFGDPNHQEPDDSANFRLIAAAPDMHVALRQAKGALMWIIAYDSEDKCLARAIEAIETALAKAEGAEQ